MLGNTGSGKSCSVAGLIRWSLEAARKARGEEDPNARFIVLDPNGEYAKTFKDLGNVRIYAVEPSDEEDIQQLHVPLWFWNSAEWSAFTQASSKVQRPALVQALRAVRDGTFTSGMTPSHNMRRYLRTLVAAAQVDRNSGNPWRGVGPARGFRDRLSSWAESLVNDASLSAIEDQAINGLNQYIVQLLSGHQGEWPEVFTLEEVDGLIAQLSSAHSKFGGSNTDILPIGADVPRQFSGDQLLRSLEATADQLGVSEYVETMQTRIRTIFSDNRMKVVSGDNKDVTLDQWLRDYIGDNQSSNGSITVIDLSLVPAEVVHIITAVIARMTLESLQRYRKLYHGKVLPTALVMEEAHTFVKRYNDDRENQSSAAICCQVFEKIAREGRKFGLGLVLSSQRPPNATVIYCTVSAMIVIKS